MTVAMNDRLPPEHLNISLEPHLIDTLRPLLSITPSELASILRPYVSSNPPSTIPYSVLQSVSQWARTTGLNALRTHSPPLDPHAFSMVSLLAGSTTSPERKLGQFTPAKDPEEIQAEKNKERKMITALLNALLSVLGSGFAAWWASDRTGWKNEWKVLFGLFVSVVVAVTEAALYLIWQSRRSDAAIKRAKSRRRVVSARHKKDDGPDTPDTITSPTQVTDKGLRRRH